MQIARFVTELNTKECALDIMFKKMSSRGDALSVHLINNYVVIYLIFENTKPNL